VQLKLGTQFYMIILQINSKTIIYCFSEWQWMFIFSRFYLHMLKAIYLSQSENAENI